MPVMWVHLTDLYRSMGYNCNSMGLLSSHKRAQPAWKHFLQSHGSQLVLAGMGVTLQHLEKLLRPHSRRYTVPGCEPVENEPPAGMDSLPSQE